MSGLSESDLEALFGAETSADVLVTVELIVARHVAAALTQAADLLAGFLHDPACESCDDVRECIAVVRSRIPT